MKNLIVLLTDFGNSFYVGEMKGVIKSINSDAEIVDLCHDIEPQNLNQACLILGCSYKYFPRNTIFICVVDPGVGSKREIVILKTYDHLFLAPNNGVLTSIITSQKEFEVFKVYNSKYYLSPLSNTFHGRDIFAPVSAYLSLDLDYLLKICKPYSKKKLKFIKNLKPKIRKVDNQISIVGKAVFSDRFGNIITNISAEYLDKRIDSVYIFYKNNLIYKIPMKKFYTQVKSGEFLAYINSFWHLEIAVNCGNAYQNLMSHVTNIQDLDFVVKR